MSDDKIIFPNTTLIGNCDLGNANEIGPNVVLENVKAGDNNKISNCTIRNKTIKDNEILGE